LECRPFLVGGIAVDNAPSASKSPDLNGSLIVQTANRRVAAI
jgi:hypothetical protein